MRGLSQAGLLLLVSGTVLSAQQITGIGDPYFGLPYLAPGSLVSIQGTDLGGLPANVTFNGKPLKVLSATGQTQLLVQIPVDAPLGSNMIAITSSTNSSSVTFTLAQYAPELVLAAAGQTTAMAIHTLSGAPVTSSNPAVANETISVFAIGLGPTNPVVPTGTAATNPNAVTTTVPTVILGSSVEGDGTNVRAFMAVGQVGIYQINFTMPNLPTGAQPITILIGGTQSIGHASIAVGVSPIKGLSNNYSFTINGLPNYGIAQGSIFDIFGTNLAPSSSSLQTVPLPTSLNGVTVTVTVNNTTTNVIFYFVTPNQITGILPSNTPVGTGTLTVMNGSQIVGSTSIQVVQSAFGILTLNGIGTGQAAAFDLKNNYITFTNALNPGDFVVLWGTGVGPVPAGTNETVLQTATNLTNVPFQAWIGGVPATVFYHGRSQYPGVDQVILIVPQKVTPGCYVSVVGQSGNIVTNFATVAVAATGRTCSEPTLGFDTSRYQSIAAKGTFAGGIIGIDKATVKTMGLSLSTDTAAAQFFGLTAPQFDALPMPFASLGSCTVYTGTDLIGLAGNASQFPLNAGAALNVSGPLGKATVPLVNNTYKAQQKPLGGVSSSGAMLPTFIPATGGTFTFDDGTGGPGVGPFSTSVTLGAGGILTWTNQSSITTINRANGLTVTWSGAGSNTFVLISGISVSQQPPYAGAQFFCSAPAAADTFTVPTAVLLSLPAGGNGQIPANSLQVSQVLFGQPFSAPLLDAAIITSGFTYVNFVTYQ